MKNKLAYIFLLCGIIISSYAEESGEKNSKTSPYVATNKDILIYTKQTIGTTVGRGECWDLAQQALDFSHSIWRKPHQFGFPLKKNAAILAGDIIQFQSARFEWVKGNRSGWKQFGAPNHTAIIYTVTGKQLQLAHQNVNGVRKVLLENIDLKNLVSGTYQVYRPYKKKH